MCLQGHLTIQDHSVSVDDMGSTSSQDDEEERQTIEKGFPSLEKDPPPDESMVRSYLESCTSKRLVAWLLGCLVVC
jgi:hypothetical protein